MQRETEGQEWGGGDAELPAFTLVQACQLYSTPEFHQPESSLQPIIQLGAPVIISHQCTSKIILQLRDFRGFMRTCVKNWRLRPNIIVIKHGLFSRNLQSTLGTLTGPKALQFLHHNATCWLEIIMPSSRQRYSSSRSNK